MANYSDAVVQWAAINDMDPCIGQAFAEEHGGRLPANDAELCTWGKQTGYRRDDGTWSCTREQTSSNATTGNTWLLVVLVGFALLALTDYRRR